MVDELQEANDELPAISESTVHLAFVHELFRFLRWSAVAASIVVGLYFVIQVIVEVVTDDKNPWIEIVAIFAAILTALLATQTPTFRRLRKFRLYISQHTKRTAELEASVDEDRTSSGIDHDGTSPID